MKTILFNLRLFCALTFCNDANLRSTNKQDHRTIGNRVSIVRDTAFDVGRSEFGLRRLRKLPQGSDPPVRLSLGNFWKVWAVFWP